MFSVSFPMVFLKADQIEHLDRPARLRGVPRLDLNGELAHPAKVPDHVVDNEAAVALLFCGKAVDEVQDVALKHDSCRYSFDLCHAAILA